MKKLLFLLPLAFIACGSPSNEEGTEQTEETNSDSVEVKKEEPATDTTAKEDSGPVVEDPNATSIKAYEQANKGGLSFCDCVKKQEEFNKLLETAPDDEVEKVLSDMEALKKGECKVLDMGPQTSPAQRAQREAMVKKCLTK